MSVSLLEVIENGGYKPLNDKNDAGWLLSKRQEFDELVEQAEDFLEELERLEYEAEEAQELHSRLDERHYMTCKECFEAHLDFMQDQAIDDEVEIANCMEV